MKCSRLLICCRLVVLDNDDFENLCWICWGIWIIVVLHNSVQYITWNALVCWICCVIWYLYHSMYISWHPLQNDLFIMFVMLFINTVRHRWTGNGMYSRCSHRWIGNEMYSRCWSMSGIYDRAVLFSVCLYLF